MGQKLVSNAFFYGDEVTQCLSLGVDLFPCDPGRDYAFGGNGGEIKPFSGVKF